MISNVIAMGSSLLAGRILNSINSGTQISEISGQDENINISIEYKNGDKEEKNIWTY